MPGTNSIYEEPSRLSQGLVVGLSIAVVVMAGWFVVTISVPRSATTSADGETDAAAAPPAATEGAAISGDADAPRRHSRSVHFDWPAEFAPATPPPPPPQAALPLAPEIPATRDVGQQAWPAAATPDARSLPMRQPPGAEATDAIVGILAPPSPRVAAGKDAAASRQAQRRQKPRTDGDAAQ